jgi:hypothetical protein
MDAIQEQFVSFVEGLEDPAIPFAGRIYRSMNLKVFIKNINQWESFHDWWKSKNMTPYFNKNVIKSILSVGPPDSVKNILISMTL